MGRSQYKVYETYFPYFLTSTIVDGIALFTEPEIAQFVLNGFQYMQKHCPRLAIGFFACRVICLRHGSRQPKRIRQPTRLDFLNKRNRYWLLQQLKRTKLKHKSQSQYQIWQEGYHPKQLTTPAMMIQKIEYIHNNPVKRGYVDVPEHWRYSSARNYLDLQGVISVTLYEG